MNEHFDLIRIFFGDATWMILLEIAFRTTVLFVFTLLMMRTVGHRGLGQLSMAEFVLILALGSAVGDPMFYVDIPLIYGMLVITLIATYQIILTKITARSQTLTTVVDGLAIRLVVDGMLDLEGVSKARLSRPEVMAELRHCGIESMGEIKRAYLEMDGKISVFPYKKHEARPGVSLLPDYIETSLKWSCDDILPENQLYSCANCGYTQRFPAGTLVSDCPRCHVTEWMEAIEPSYKRDTKLSLPG